MKQAENEKGFLIIEAIVAIFVVGVSMVAFITVLSAAFRQNINNRDYAIASGLAQEGVELIRNIRDNNWKENGTAFDSTGTYKFPDSNSSGKCYEIDINDAVPTALSNCSSSLRKLSLGKYTRSGDSGYVYLYLYPSSGSGNTKFSRRITVKGTSDDRTISSEVFWRPTGSSSDTSIKVEDTLNNWGDQ